MCLSRGHSLKNEYTIRLYWNCRIGLIQERIDKEYNHQGRNKFYIKELKRIKAVIKNITTKIESDLITKQHLFGPDEREKVLYGEDKYYYNLLSFLKRDYTLEKVNTSKEIKKIIAYREKQLNQEKKFSVNDQLKKFPECIKYDVNSEDFKNCVNKNNKIQECKELAMQKLKEKDNEIKFKCKKEAIDKYPDYMALYNDEYEELKSVKFDQYVYDKEKIQQREQRMQELNRLMSGPRISKTQLINLRQFAEKKCLLDNEMESSYFKVSLDVECEKLLNQEKAY